VSEGWEEEKAEKGKKYNLTPALSEGEGAPSPSEKAGEEVEFILLYFFA
jgi:hypothetical protein